MMASVVGRYFTLGLVCGAILALLGRGPAEPRTIVPVLPAGGAPGARFPLRSTAVRAASLGALQTGRRRQASARHAPPLTRWQASAPLAPDELIAFSPALRPLLRADLGGLARASPLLGPERRLAACTPGRGRPDPSTGECQCRTGWTGRGCDTPDPQQCNDPRSEGKPPGSCRSPFCGVEYTHMLSRCASRCDLESNRCLCGSRSRYPGRHLFKCEWRGAGQAFEWRDPGWGRFQVVEPWRLWADPNSTPPHLAAAAGPALLARLWADAPPSARSRAYCEIDEADLLGGKAPLVSCSCYEDRVGGACQVPVRSFCLNQCTGRGECVRGWCVCGDGWAGSDCSVPLGGGSGGGGGKGAGGGREGAGGGKEGAGGGADPSLAAMAVGGTGARLRPSIYVYELPAKFNTWLAETRVTPEDCVYRR